MGTHRILLLASITKAIRPTFRRELERQLFGLVLLLSIVLIIDHLVLVESPVLPETGHMKPAERLLLLGKFRPCLFVQLQTLAQMRRHIADWFGRKRSPLVDTTNLRKLVLYDT